METRCGTQILISCPLRIGDQAPADSTYPVPEIVARVLNIQKDNRSTATRMLMLLCEFLYGYQDIFGSQSLYIIHMLIKACLVASEKNKDPRQYTQAFLLCFTGNHGHLEKKLSSIVSDQAGGDQPDTDLRRGYYGTYRKYDGNFHIWVI